MRSSLACCLFVLRTSGASGSEPASKLSLPGWPGADADLSNAAWPPEIPGGVARQPGRLAAWPVDSAGNPLPCPNATVTVLHDKSDGWPGQCLGLLAPADAAGATTAALCGAKCSQDPSCSVWQFIAGTASGSGCFMDNVAAANSCYGRDSNGVIQVQAAQRIQHGYVTVLKDMSAWWVLNLMNKGTFGAGDADAGVARCRAQCYSDIYCQYWQYGDGGCWVETQAYTAEAPLTTPNGALGPGDDARATTIKGAEYIQHSCTAPSTTSIAPIAATGSFGEGLKNSLSDYWWAWLAGACVLLLICAACSCCSKRASKKRAVKKRAVKAQPREGEDGDSREMQRLMDRSTPATPQSSFMSVFPVNPYDNLQINPASFAGGYQGMPLQGGYQGMPLQGGYQGMPDPGFQAAQMAQPGGFQPTMFYP